MIDPPDPLKTVWRTTVTGETYLELVAAFNNEFDHFWKGIFVKDARCEWRIDVHEVIATRDSAGRVALRRIEYEAEVTVTL